MEEIEDFEPGRMEIDHEFWDLFSQLVGIVWHTRPGDRLGLVPPILKEHYGRARTDVYERIENHVLRTVAWMERFEDAEVLDEL